MGVAFGFGDFAQRVLHEGETVLAGGGARVLQEAVLNERLGMRIVALAIEDHGEPEERGCIAAVGEVNGLLELFAGLVELAGAEKGEAEVVVETVGVGGLLDGLTEERDAARRVAFDEKRGGFLEDAFGFRGSGKLLDGNGGLVAGAGSGGVRRRLRAAHTAGNRYSEENQRKAWSDFHVTPIKRKQLPLALL